MLDRQDTLGTFLKRKRAHAHLHLHQRRHDRRHVRGLRREEVAVQAGIGVDWYTWLEQDRPNARPSADVLRRISIALRLTPPEVDYLFNLAGLRVPEPPAPLPTTLNPALRHVLDRQPAPAYVLNLRWDVLAWNQAAGIVFGYNLNPDLDRNVARFLFTSDVAQRMIEHWEVHARNVIAQLRADYGQRYGDPDFRALIEYLTAHSYTFATWWPEHEVQIHAEIAKVIRHPHLGRLALEQSAYEVMGAAGLRLMLYVPADDETAAKLLQVHTMS